MTSVENLENIKKKILCRSAPAFCRSVAEFLRARLALLDVLPHHTCPSVWPWALCPSPCASVYSFEKWG